MVADDTDIRNEVLDPRRSFLIQAPAGSGKTELLIQRYLKLLTVVDEPEEILAITFTRKAAAEMRARVHEALERAHNREEPSEDYLRIGYALAVDVLERERARDWQLRAQPNRLRIGTIDSVNARLARRAPLSAGPTSSNQLIEITEPLYRAAARQTIFHAEERDAYGAAVRLLLDHCDNRVDRLETLLARMLARRDQWMPMLAAGRSGPSASLRKNLENNLALLIENTLRDADAHLSRHRPELFECLTYAGASISIENPGSELAAWRDADTFPEPAADSVGLWRAMANVFLTKEGRWRKAHNKNQGFPPDGKQMKARAKDLLEVLQRDDDLGAVLALVRLLPSSNYSDEQWRVLEALLFALPLAAANLKQIFFRDQQTDFCEIAQEALASLGSEENTTAMSLALDYQVRHMLLDEFQDTSRSQFEMIGRMTVGWQGDMERTMFLVGDPMQSIYRFRQAEVGLFLEAKRDLRIGDVRLTFRRLTKNFRSDPEIVNWFNGVFAQIMPEPDGGDAATGNPMAGAISFAPSDAVRIHDKASFVKWHVVPYGDRDMEARTVVQTIKETQADCPDETIAVLVRSRQHGMDIAKHLRADTDISFVADDLEALDEQPVIQDLMALTRALSHRGDRLAWLAILRAPWCGLSLSDLTALAAADPKAVVWDLIGNSGSAGKLSDDGRRRLDRVREPLATGLQRSGLISLRDRVEAVWIALGGPAALERTSGLELADLYFEFLDTIDTAGDCADNAALLESLKAWRPAGRIGSGKLQLITMHKAKGLEFDTVILPGLGYSTRTDERPLLAWQELATTEEVRPLVLAPVHGTGNERDEIFEFLWTFEQHQANLEQDRLLYVAATRAKRRLHLFAPLGTNKSGSVEPASGSLLKRLWPAVETDIELSQNLPRRSARDPDRPPDWFEIAIDRLPADWRLPDFPPAWDPGRPGLEGAEESDVEFDWVSTWARHVGTVVHEWLETIATTAPSEFDAKRIAVLRPKFARRLAELGVDAADIERATGRVSEALIKTIESEKGAWILSDQHVDAGSEISITARREAGFEQLKLDRTFVSECGERWIIDYKTSTHEGGDLDHFLKSESDRYRSQLKAYRDVMTEIDPRPIRTALYFPLMDYFCEVEVDA